MYPKVSIIQCLYIRLWCKANAIPNLLIVICEHLSDLFPAIAIVNCAPIKIELVKNLFDLVLN